MLRSSKSRCCVGLGNKITNRMLTVSSSSFNIVVVALCDGHRQRLMLPIDVQNLPARVGLAARSWSVNCGGLALFGPN